MDSQIELTAIYDDLDKLLPTMEVWYASIFAIAVCFGIFVGIMYMVCYNGSWQSIEESNGEKPRRRRKKVYDSI